MSWCQDVDETRVLIAPDPGVIGSNLGRFLLLRHPKSGNATRYLFVNGVLQELHWFKESYRSWFLGDYICEDGRLYMATPIDPIFVMLPIFEEARMKKVEDPGKFRQLDEIIFVPGYPGYQDLLSLVENFMHIVCEVREIGSTKFYRLDDSKVLAWLYYKVCQLKQTLPALDRNYAAQDEKDTLADAISIVGEYLRAEPWLKLLCDHLKLDSAEVARRASHSEVIAASRESNMELPNHVKEKSNDRRITRSVKQSKKAKVETESRNIKEMFFRASKRAG
ncbi:ribonuclease H2 subunit B isoform X2 [Carica papaya]|uniref:ribonuclease H2 subunit B isoform X2 n=1 Tax=Carica papaya TaxID=3649 RepID=UPI000B8D1A70|nr:ribonuclease H2 subunit B isoform X2 [Carica papaya]